ncbi:MAG TPA: response regulator [Geobacteraceae bacterium]
MTAEIHTIGGDGNRKMLGEIFVKEGLLTEVTVKRMVEQARSKNIRFGDFLEHIGLVTSEELAEALAIQYRCRKIRNFSRHSFSQQLLRMIPIEMAVEHTIFPLKLEEGKLGLAVIDPTTEKLFGEIAAQHNVRVIPFISTRTDINRAIARHYMGRNIAEPGEKLILLVEDDALIRTAVSNILTRHGYVVDSAPDAMEAFKKIFTHKPRLVITDKVMPKLGGYEFLEAVRKIPEFRFTPVILMTANATPDEEKLALEKGFFDFILKPVKEIGLLTRVRRAFQSVERAYGKTA